MRRIPINQPLTTSRGFTFVDDHPTFCYTHIGSRSQDLTTLSVIHKPWASQKPVEAPAKVQVKTLPEKPWLKKNMKKL